MFSNYDYALKTAKAAAKSYGFDINKSWTADDIFNSIESCDSYAIEDEDEAKYFMNAFG